MSEQYEWTAEEREVPALKRIVKTGDTFEASKEVAEHLIAQGLARPVEAKPKKSKTPTE